MIYVEIKSGRKCSRNTQLPKFPFAILIRLFICIVPNGGRAVPGLFPCMVPNSDCSLLLLLLEILPQLYLVNTRVLILICRLLTWQLGSTFIFVSLMSFSNPLLMFCYLQLRILFLMTPFSCSRKELTSPVQSSGKEPMDFLRGLSLQLFPGHYFASLVLH